MSFVLVTLAVLVVPVFVDVPPLLAPAWIAVAATLAFSACIINHNHVHRAMCRTQAANALMGLLLTLAKGHTSAGVIVAHNSNHHRHGGNTRDWVRTELAGAGWGLGRMLRYVVMASRSMAHGRSAPDSPRLPAAKRRQLAHEKIALAAFATAALIVNPHAAVLFIGLPWGAAMLCLVGVNLLQHDGCDPASKYAHSRNFTSPFGNWLFFNNGYHTIHHMHPTLHWSELPAAHRREVAPHLPPHLAVQSIVGFGIRNYLLNFEGAPEELATQDRV